MVANKGRHHTAHGTLHSRSTCALLFRVSPLYTNVAKIVHPVCRNYQGNENSSKTTWPDGVFRWQKQPENPLKWRFSREKWGDEHTVRDREVGGSNPLAPTGYADEHTVFHRVLIGVKTVRKRCPAFITMVAGGTHRQPKR